MIQEVTMHTVICDHCGIDIGSIDDYAAWTDSQYAEDNAIDSDWTSPEDDKHYCPKCHYYNADDVLVLWEHRKNLHVKQEKL